MLSQKVLVLGAVRANSRARDGEGQGEAVVAGSWLDGLSVLSLIFSAEVLARPVIEASLRPYVGVMHGARARLDGPEGPA